MSPCTQPGPQLCQSLKKAIDCNLTEIEKLKSLSFSGAQRCQRISDEIRHVFGEIFWDSQRSCGFLGNFDVRRTLWTLWARLARGERPQVQSGVASTNLDLYIVFIWFYMVLKILKTIFSVLGLICFIWFLSYTHPPKVIVLAGDL